MNQSGSLVLLSALEVRVALANLFPCVGGLRQVHKDLFEVDDRHAKLLHCVELSQGDGLLLKCLEVDGNAEGDSDFVGSSVSLSDRLAGIVDLAGDQVSLQSQF